MKRIEMIEHLNDFLEENGHPDPFGKRVFATQLLSFMESKGMTLPSGKNKIAAHERKIGSRWEKGIKHHPKSIELMDFLQYIDFHVYDDHFCWKVGGDGDNGEALMYQLDAFFEAEDRGETKL